MELKYTIYKFLKILYHHIKQLFRDEQTRQLYFTDPSGEERQCWIEDSQPTDERDFIFQEMLPGYQDLHIPAQYSMVRPSLIRSQGATTLCTAEALSLARELSLLRNRQTFKASSGYIYAHEDGSPTMTNGMWPRYGHRLLISHGATPHSLFPRRGTRQALRDLMRPILPLLDDTAQHQKTTAYMFLNPTDIHAMQRAILTTGALTAVWRMFPSASNTPRTNQPNSGIMPNPTLNEVQRSLHTMTIVGWRLINNLLYWEVVDSWGEHNHDRGMYYIDAVGNPPMEVSVSKDDTIRDHNNFIKEIHIFPAPRYGGRWILADDMELILPKPARVIAHKLFVPMQFFEILGLYAELTYHGTVLISKDEKMIYRTVKPNPDPLGFYSFMDDGYPMIELQPVLEAFNFRLTPNLTNTDFTITDWRSDMIIRYPLVQLGRISSRFGPRTHPITGQINSMHNGVDIVLTHNTHPRDILAVADGRVTAVISHLPDTHTGTNVTSNTAGNYVFYDIGEGINVRCMHLAGQSVRVRTGDRITRGQLIGMMGSTGASTGRHLHFEMRRNGQAIDPTPFLNTASFTDIIPPAPEPIPPPPPPEPVDPNIRPFRVNGTIHMFERRNEADRNFLRATDLFFAAFNTRLERATVGGEAEFVQFRQFFEAMGWEVTFPEDNIPTATR